MSRPALTCDRSLALLCRPSALIPRMSRPARTETGNAASYQVSTVRGRPCKASVMIRVSAPARRPTISPSTAWKRATAVPPWRGDASNGVLGPNVNNGLGEFCQTLLPSTETLKMVWSLFSPALMAMKPGRHGVGSGVSAPEIDTA